MKNAALPLNDAPQRVPLTIIVAFVLMVLGLGLSYLLTPRHKLADSLPPIVLESLVPKTFGGWREDVSIAQVLPDPTVQAQLDALYSQVLSRTYVNAKGQRIMLTIAYGSDQNSEATAAHRPEFCYRAQGFVIQDKGIERVALKDHSLTVRRLLGTAGGRVEPISYWVTLADRASLPGLSRKLSQIYFGLQGEIADGMLVRVSTVGLPLEEAYVLQDAFLASMEAAVPADFRPRFFGI
jgi:EpsI family protein